MKLDWIAVGPNAYMANIDGGFFHVFAAGHRVILHQNRITGTARDLSGKPYPSGETIRKQVCRSYTEAQKIAEEWSLVEQRQDSDRDPDNG